MFWSVKLSQASTNRNNNNTTPSSSSNIIASSPLSATNFPQIGHSSIDDNGVGGLLLEDSDNDLANSSSGGGAGAGSTGIISNILRRHSAQFDPNGQSQPQQQPIVSSVVQTALNSVLGFNSQNNSPKHHQHQHQQQSQSHQHKIQAFEKKLRFNHSQESQHNKNIFMDSSYSMSSSTGIGVGGGIGVDHQLEIDNYGLGYFFGDPLGIHDPSETELGGVGHETTGPFAKRSRKILRGLFLMILVALCWVATIHLFRMSFHRERLLFSITAAPHYNISKYLNHNNNNPFNKASQTSNKNLLETATTTTTSTTSTTTTTTFSPKNFQPPPPESLPYPMALLGKFPKSRQKVSIALNEFPRSKFDAPYLVTWYCSIWNIFYLPVYLMIHAYILSRRNKANQQQQQSISDQTVGSNSAGSSAISNNPFGSNTSNNKNQSGSILSGGTGQSSTDTLSSTSMKKVLLESIQGLVDRGFTLVQFFSRVAFFCVLCTLANYMLIFSLRILDATVVMALLSSSVSIIYLLSWVVLHQQFVGIRIVGIIVVDTGVALLVYMDGIQHQTLATVMIAFGSAIVFGVYKVFMRRMIGYTTFAQMALFHTLIGLFNAILAWPLILILYATGVEIIVWSEIPWLYMTGACICSLFANLIASFGVICTYEFFITMGIFFAILISAVIDIYINSVIFRDMKLGGVLLILCGFLVVLLPDNWNENLTNLFRNRLKKWKQREENKKNSGRGGGVQDTTTTGQLSRLRTSSGRVK